MSNVKKWKSGTWRLGKTRTKEPEMVESPLPYNWSPSHDYDRFPSMQNSSADHWSDSENLTVQRQGSLSESPEVREKLESLASGNAKKPGIMRSDSAGSLHLSSHVSDLLHLEESCKQLKDDRDTLEQLLLAEQMKLCQREEEFAVKERECAEATQKASQAVELERELKSSNDCIAKLEQILGEKLAESKTSADYVRTIEARLQEAEQCMVELTKRFNQSNKNLATSLDARNGEDQRTRVEVIRLQQELVQSERRCAETKQALELKITETNQLKERVCSLEGQSVHLEETSASVRTHLEDMEEEFSKLQADQVALQLQLELESTNHARCEEEWSMEREELEAQISHLETEIQLTGCSNGELDFLITPVKKGYSDRALGSPRTPNGLSIQTLLDMGEASLEVEEDVHELQIRLADAEVRGQNALHELAVKFEELEHLKQENTRLKEEVAAEKDKAKEEAEDLTQEMAELRYQMMEMIEQERELRAQAEQASVLRVEELEAQVKNARQQVVHALACRREAEMQSDHWVLENQRLQLALENTEQQAREAEEITRQAQLAVEAEAMQGKENVARVMEAKLEVEKQVRELFAAHDCLSSENIQLRMSLDEAVVTTAKLAKTLEKRELEFCALMEQESIELEATPKEENKVLSLQEGNERIVDPERGYAQSDASSIPMDIGADILEQEITVESVGEKKDDPDCGIITEAPELEVDKRLSSNELLEVGQACNGQGQEVTDFENDLENNHDDPLLERVKVQLANLDKLQLANEQLRFELEGLQLQSVSDDFAGVDESLVSQVAGGSDSRESDVDHVYSGSGLSPEVKELTLELEGMLLEKPVPVSEVDTVAVEKETQAQTVWSGLRETGDTPGTPGLQDKFVCTSKQDQAWTIKEMAETVEAITEELAKHLKQILKAPLSTKQDLADELESQMRSWSNVSSKGLQTMLSVNGAIGEWGELAVDLLGQSRRELVTAHKKLLDCEVDLGYLESLRQERVAASKEVTRLKDEIDRLEESHASEIRAVTGELSIVRKNLEAAMELEVTLRRQLAEAELAIQYSSNAGGIALPSSTSLTNSHLLESQERSSKQDVLR